MLTGAHLRDQPLVATQLHETTGDCQGSEDFQCSHSQGWEKLPSVTKDNSPLSPLPGETFPSSQKRSSWKHPTLNASYGRLKAFTGNLLQCSGGQLSTLCGLLLLMTSQKRPWRLCLFPEAQGAFSQRVLELQLSFWTCAVVLARAALNPFFSILNYGGVHWPSRYNNKLNSFKQIDQRNLTNFHKSLEIGLN